jgi:hypothetical protein
VFNERTKGGLNPRGQQPQSNLQISTIRSFDGGLNTADTDLNMSPQYARVLDNIERGLDGSLSVRYGTKFLANLTDAGSFADIVNIEYFNGYVIAVQTDASICAVAGDGTVTLLDGPAALWTDPVAYVSFSVFNGNLILCNGNDKPLIIAGDPTDPNYMVPQYLEDIASGSNVNVPIGRYVVTHSQYLIVAGVVGEPSTIYISSKGTSGTFPGDAPPNDSIAIDLGPRVSIGDSTITGLVAYRDKLLVTFERGVLPLNLGVYVGSPEVHTPTDDGFIEEFGCQAHRSLTSVGDDTFYVDNVGVNSIARVSVFNTLRPVRTSHLIDPQIANLMKKLTREQIDKYVFAVYDLRHFRYILFVPDVDDLGNLNENMAFSYTNIPTMKIQAWARLRGWEWVCACRTALENIIFGAGSSLYYYNFDDENSCADYVNDPDAPDNPLGYPIDFTWELPWADFKHRMDIKYTRYIGMDTQGTGPFTCSAFVDNIDSEPLLSIDMRAGDTSGYGAGGYGEGGFGAGRRAQDERLLAFPIKFKLLKLKFSGTTMERIKFVSISLAYLHGSIRR